MIRDTDILTALLDTVRRFVRERLVPAEDIVAETDTIPADIVRDMKTMGLFGLTIPESYGGLNLTMEEEALVMIELCQTAPAFRSLIGTTVGIGSQGILSLAAPVMSAPTRLQQETTTPTRRSTSARSLAGARTSPQLPSTRATRACCSGARTTTAASTTAASRQARSDRFGSATTGR